MFPSFTLLLMEGAGMTVQDQRHNWTTVFRVKLNLNEEKNT